MSGILASIISEELTNGCLIPHSSTTPPPVFHRPLCSFFWFLKAFDLGTYLLVLSSQFSFLNNNIMYIQPTIKDWQKPRLGSSFVCNVVPCTKRLRVRSLIGGQPIDISPSLSLKSINMSTHVRIKKKGLARNGHMLLLTVAVSWWWRYRWFLWNTFHFLVSDLPFIWNTYDQGEKHFLNGKLQDNAVLLRLSELMEQVPLLNISNQWAKGFPSQIGPLGWYRLDPACSWVRARGGSLSYSVTFVCIRNSPQ